MFNKALSSSHLASVNPTSLSGSAGKEFFLQVVEKLQCLMVRKEVI